MTGSHLLKTQVFVCIYMHACAVIVWHNHYKEEIWLHFFVICDMSDQLFSSKYAESGIDFLKFWSERYYIFLITFLN